MWLDDGSFTHLRPTVFMSQQDVAEKKKELDSRNVPYPCDDIQNKNLIPRNCSTYYLYYLRNVHGATQLLADTHAFYSVMRYLSWHRITCACKLGYRATLYS
jgi:hypothetical protein